MKKITIFLLPVCSPCCFFYVCGSGESAKPRILISTDIGGTDPDDNQSMAHFLMYSNLFETEGLVSSPSYGSGSVSEILRMIDLYEQDLPELQKHADGFPLARLPAFHQQAGPERCSALLRIQDGDRGVGLDCSVRP